MTEQRERVEAEAMKLYPIDPQGIGYSRTLAKRGGFIAGRTVTTEQVEAAATRDAWEVEGLDLRIADDYTRNQWFAHHAGNFRAAGLLIEGDE